MECSASSDGPGRLGGTQQYLELCYAVIRRIDGKALHGRADGKRDVVLDSKIRNIEEQRSGHQSLSSSRTLAGLSITVVNHKRAGPAGERN